MEWIKNIYRVLGGVKSIGFERFVDKIGRGFINLPTVSVDNWEYN